MMLAGLFTLLLLTGGNTSSLQPQQHFEDLPGSFQSFEEMSGGNTSDPEYSDPPLLLMPGNVDMNSMNYPNHETFQLIFEEIRENDVNVHEGCSSYDVLKHLNLTENSDKYTLGRPVKHLKHLTWVLLEMKIYAILDVRETDQTFIAYIWIYLRWDNEYVWWYPEQFCGVKHILVPTKLLWMPDLTIEEIGRGNVVCPITQSSKRLCVPVGDVNQNADIDLRVTEQDKAAPSPYLSIRSHGWVEFRNDQVVVSTCKMRVYKFPFDMQSCNISFKSIMHSDEEIKLFYNSNNTEITDWSRKTMQTQYEWLFVSMTVTTKTVNHFGFNQTMIVYTINMKRRSVLYIANFLLPVLFFLCLDFASLLMSDTSGEKVGFKITVLLAVTVMQLILNEILPSSSDKIPLIAVYCIGTFALMLLSLLETILVSHLIDKDASQETEGEKTNCPTEGNEEELTNIKSCFIGIKKCSNCSFVKPSADVTPFTGKESGMGGLPEVSLALEKMSEELEEIKKSIILHGGREDDKKHGYWTRTAKIINKVFAIVYVTAAILFLVVVSTLWYFVDEE